MRKLLYVLRFLWVLLALLLLAHVGFRLPGRPTVLIDRSFSARLVFGKELLDTLAERFRREGFAVSYFGSDTLTDIYGALKGAKPPVLLVSDGMHNAEGDPLSAAYDREVNVLLLTPRSIPAKITDVRMRNPAPIGKETPLTVEFSAPLNDTVVLLYGDRRQVSYATDRATFRVRVDSKEKEARILTRSDTLSFRVFGREAGGIGILVWTPTPVVRFLRWFLTDAALRLMRDTAEVKGRYAFTVFVDPPFDTLSVRSPSLYVLGPRGGFKVARGAFYVRGDVPPIREIYLPDVKWDRVYERVGNFPLIASKGNALFVLSPDIWKVWLADPSSYDRFLDYLRGFVVRDYEVFADKPIYAVGEMLRINVYPPFPMAVSVNGGKPVRISSLYTYTERLKAGDTLFTLDIFRRGVRVASETVRINLRDVPAEKVYVGVDTALLKSLASVSGGEVFRDAEEAVRVMREKGGREFKLSSLLPLFVLVVLLAWVEWFVRRARGMV